MQISYFAIIPANVRYDKDLTPNAKLLYGEITALCNEKGYCWATNEYFSELYEVSKVSISKWINQLVSKGYLFSEIVYREGTKEILGRYLTILNDPIKEKLNRGIKEKFKENNTLENSTINNKEKNTKKKYGEFENVLLTDDEYKKLQEKFPRDYDIRIERISGYLESTGKKYKSHYATILNWARKDEANRKPVDYTTPYGWTGKSAYGVDKGEI